MKKKLRLVGLIVLIKVLIYQRERMLSLRNYRISLKVRKRLMAILRIRKVKMDKQIIKVQL